MSEKKVIAKFYPQEWIRNWPGPGWVEVQRSVRTYFGQTA